MAEKDIDMRLLCEAWDDMDSASQKVCDALPHQMTAAAANLDHARLRMRAVLQSILGGRGLHHPRLGAQR